MKIAVDVDGVILQTLSMFCDIYNEMFKDSKGFKRKILDDVKSWSFYKKWDLPEPIVWDIFDKVNERLLDVPLIDKYAKVVMRKMKANNIVDIVTARKKEVADLLSLKLTKHKILENVHYDSLITVNRRHKNAKAKMDYDLYIDDSPHLAKAIKEYKNKILFLFDQNWNRHFKCEGNIIRVHGWKEVWTTYQKIKSEKSD